MLPNESNMSDWVLRKVKEIQYCVGMECIGYEEQFMALFIAIEADHSQSKKLGSKKQRELKRHTWSMNDEGSSSRARAKGKGLGFPL